MRRIGRENYILDTFLSYLQSLVVKRKFLDSFVPCRNEGLIHGYETEIGIGPMTSNPKNSRSTVTDRRAERAGTDDADGRTDGGGRFYSNVSYTGINACRSSPVQMPLARCYAVVGREGGRRVGLNWIR